MCMTGGALDGRVPGSGEGEGKGEDEVQECDDSLPRGGCSAARSADETDSGRVRAAALRRRAAMSLDVGGWPGKLARGCCCTGV